MVTLTNMQSKEIIAVNSGKKIGTIIDLDINAEKGVITHIIVGGKNKSIPLFGKTEEIVISWEDIVTVGSDVILINRSSQQ